MKNLFSIVLLFTALLSSAQEKKELPKSQIVEVSCGECNFGLKGKSCDLAVRIDGKAYFVDGTNIDDHGDSHAKDGFCQAIRKAEVTGEIVNGRFKVTSFTLLPEQK
jgi:hypothetical protein